MRLQVRLLAPLAAVAALLGGCTSATSDPEVANADDPVAPDPGDDADAVAEPTEEEEPEAPSCRKGDIDADAAIERTGADAVEVAIGVAELTHRCASVVVVADVDDWVASIAAVVAAALDVPLLLADPAAPDALDATFERLGTDQLVTVGLDLAGFDLPGSELLAADATDATDATDAAGAADAGSAQLQLAVEVARYLDTDRYLAVDVADQEARAAALARLAPDTVLLPLTDDLEAAAVALPPTAQLQILAADGAGQPLVDRLLGLGVDAQVAAMDEGLWPATVARAGAATSAWLADPADGAGTAVAAVAAAARGEVLLPIHGEDLRAGRDRTDRLRDAEPGSTVIVGDVTQDADWQVATVLEGEPLPGGGFRLFEDEVMVALYGSVETSVLGALGEQGLDETVARLRTVAEPYGADGAAVLPAFELITTIASASAEPTGDYSRRTPIDLLRPWVDRAAEEGFYVFLDLQPGRTDFLTQAKEYEELLREPHVGLALDPEWRLGPEQVHLRQIGSVAAAEVQEVADWLAELTREARLPQKLLVLHQFRFSMLPDRETIVAPPELAVVVHMDGQGPIGSKYDTYAAITQGVEDRWLWGWKNFYDEDLPTPTPAQVLALDPLPVLVTYQ